MLLEQITPSPHLPQVDSPKNVEQPEESSFLEAIRRGDFILQEVLIRVPSPDPGHSPTSGKPTCPEKIAGQIASGDKAIIQQARWLLAELHRTLAQDDFASLLRRVLDLLRRAKVRDAFRKLERAAPKAARRHLEQFRRKPLGPRNPLFLPTPEEIEAACAEIQSEWSEEDRLKRLYALPGTCVEEFSLFLQCPRCGELYEAKATCRGCPVCRHSGMDRDKEVRTRKAVAR